MSLEPSTKPKLSGAEIRARKATRLRAIRLQITIYRALDERGSSAPAKIGAALGLLTAEATTLLSRKHLRDGDLAQLQAVAVRLGLRLPDEWQSSSSYPGDAVRDQMPSPKPWLRVWTGLERRTGGHRQRRR